MQCACVCMRYLREFRVKAPFPSCVAQMTSGARQSSQKRTRVYIYIYIIYIYIYIYIQNIPLYLHIHIYKHIQQHINTEQTQLNT